MGKQLTVGFHFVATRPEIFASQYILGIQGRNDFIAASRKALVYLQYYILIIVALGFVVGQHAQAGQTFQRCAIGLIVATIGLDHRVNVVEIGQAHGGADLDHLAVGAGVDNVIEAGESEVAHQAHGFSQVVVIGDDGPTLECIEEFGGVKAEHFRAAEAANHLALIGTTKGVGRIEQQLQLVLVCNGLQFLHRRSAAPEVHPDDAAGARGNHPPHRFRVQVVGERINVGEHGRNALPIQRVGRCDERIGRNDDFASQTQRTDDDLQRDGAIAHGDAVFHAAIYGDAVFKLLYQRAVIAEPVAVEHLTGIPQECFAITDVGAAHMQRLVEGRGGTVDCKIIRCIYLFHKSISN